MADEMIEWVVAQQEVAQAAVEHNRTAVLVRGCRLCGRVDTHTVHLFGMADQSVCHDREACARRQEELWL